jgi:hypothetical protein
MSTRIAKGFTGVVSGIVATCTVAAAHADGLDGTSPILCATYTVFECGPEGECLIGPPDEFDVPKMIQLDVANKKAVTLRITGEQRAIDISATQITETAIQLQGATPEFSWSATIARASGDLSLAAAGVGVGFNVFGSCGVL